MAQKLANKVPRQRGPKMVNGQEVKQVRLKLVYVDYVSAMKLSFLLGLAQLIIVVLGTFLIYIVFVQTGLFSTANNVAGEVLGKNVFDINSILSMGRAVGTGLAIGVVNLIVITVLGALAALLYNMAARVVGGLSVGFTNN
jgi:hypothetical protein